MTLLELQRALAQLVKAGRQGTPDDPYLRDVAASEGLDAIRDIAASWNAFSIERLCPLTCELLRQRGELDSAVAALGATNQQSAFVEDLAELFLAQCVAVGPGIVNDVARFEVTVLRVCLGLSASAVVEWHHDPDAVIPALVAGRPIAEALAAGDARRTVVSLDLPSLYRVCD